MKMLRKLQVHYSSFFFFSGGFNSSFVIHIICSLQMFSHPGAPLNHPLLAIQLFRSAQDISEIRVSSLLSFQLFPGCYLIQVIQCNQCILSSKTFNGVSFVWALTHRSFSRILPDSSNSFRSYSQILYKVDVRTNYHQSNVFLQDLSNSFRCCFNFSKKIHSGVPQ